MSSLTGYITSSLLVYISDVPSRVVEQHAVCQILLFLICAFDIACNSDSLKD